MIVKAIGATTQVDRHNCKITKRALEMATKAINCSLYAPYVGVNHDMAAMPIGKVVKGELISIDGGEYATQIYEDIFDFSLMQGPDKRKYYFGESTIDHRPFVDTEIKHIDSMQIEVDPVNFEKNDLDEFKQFITNECSSEAKTIMRKSLIPDPELIFTFIFGTFIFWTGKKTLEKISDKISTDLANSYDNVKKVISNAIGKFKPSNRPVTYVFRESGENVIELIIITEHSNIAFEALEPKKIEEVINKIDEYNKFFSVKIAKIQFLFNNEESKWEFNYLTTSTGQVIGTEKSYEKTAILLDKVIKTTDTDV